MSVAYNFIWAVGEAKNNAPDEKLIQYAFTRETAGTVETVEIYIREAEGSGTNFFEQTFSVTFGISDVVAKGAIPVPDGVALQADEALVVTITASTAPELLSADAPSAPAKLAFTEAADPDAVAESVAADAAPAIGPVDGLETGESMSLGYTDAQGDQITNGDDAIYGNGGDDTIRSGEGLDTVYGGAGDDVFTIALAGPGIDTDVLVGGETDEDNGGDVLDADVSIFDQTLTFTAPETGTLFDGAQTTSFSQIERFFLGEGSDTVIGSGGADYVDAGDGENSISGGGGNDTLIGWFGADRIFGGDGHDSISSGSIYDFVDGGDGNDTIDSGRHDDTVIGGDGDDSINAGSGEDNVTGGNGSDTVEASGSNYVNTASDSSTDDSVDADPDDDRDLVTIFGTSGNNRIITGDDSDTITSGGSDDTIDSGDDDDFITVSGGNNEIRAGGGNDSVLAGDGSDEIHGGSGTDTLNGGDGNDTISGGGELIGGGGNDWLFGGGNSDTITGDAGKDRIDGGLGADCLSGGDDDDRFILGTREEAFGDTIDGGTGGLDLDQLDLSDLGPLQIFEPDGVTPLNTAVPNDTDGDSFSGVVKFLDGTGAVEDILEFSEIETLIVCFAAGSGIATPSGDRAVETLRIGDMICTADGDTTAVKWVGRNTVHKFRAGAKMQPVRMRAGALGSGLPHRDLTVTADHGMVLDGYVVNAAALVNGTSIDWVPMAELSNEITYYHVETDGHRVIYANGTKTETFVDVVSRSAFNNYDEYLELYGEDRIIPEMHLPRIGSQRMLPPAIKRRLGLTEEAVNYFKIAMQP